MVCEILKIPPKGGTTCPERRRRISLTVCVSFVALFFWWHSGHASRNLTQTGSGLSPARLSLQLQNRWEKRVVLGGGETFELSVSLPKPSELPANGRVGVSWSLVEEKTAPASSTAPTPLLERPHDAFGIYTKPTGNWSKTLHALDPDVYLVYRAPVPGTYLLQIAPVTDEVPVFEGARWREDGIAPQAVAFPRLTPWPAGKSIPVMVILNPLDLKRCAAIKDAD